MFDSGYEESWQETAFLYIGIIFMSIFFVDSTYCHVILKIPYLLIFVDALILRYFEIKIIRAEIMAENVCKCKLLCLRYLYLILPLCACFFAENLMKIMSFRVKKCCFSGRKRALSGR